MGRLKLKSLGKYRIDRKLGEGAFGEVIQGTHMLSGEKVAIKIFYKNECDASKMRLIRREAVCAKRLQHRNLCRLLQILESATMFAFVFEFVQEDCLAYLERGERNGLKLSEVEARMIFRQVLAGVEAMHALNIIHRDIKPDNVCILSNDDDASGELTVKLIDYGLSNWFTSDKPHLSTKCGSPGYSAPELLVEEQTYGKEVDVWSMGVFLFAILHGRMPFGNPNLEGRNSVTHILALMYDNDFTVDGGFSASLGSMLGKVFQVNPQKRITIAELWKEDWVTGKGLGLSRPSPRTELTFARVSPDSIDEAVIGVITNEMQIDLSDYNGFVNSVANNVCDKHCAAYFLAEALLRRRAKARVSTEPASTRALASSGHAAGATHDNPWPNRPGRPRTPTDDNDASLSMADGVEQKAGDQISLMPRSRSGDRSEKGTRGAGDELILSTPKENKPQQKRRSVSVKGKGKGKASGVVTDAGAGMGTGGPMGQPSRPLRRSNTMGALNMIGKLQSEQPLHEDPPIHGTEGHGHRAAGADDVDGGHGHSAVPPPPADTYGERPSISAKLRKPLPRDKAPRRNSRHNGSTKSMGSGSVARSRIKEDRTFSEGDDNLGVLRPKLPPGHLSHSMPGLGPDALPDIFSARVGGQRAQSDNRMDRVGLGGTSGAASLQHAFRASSSNPLPGLQKVRRKSSRNANRSSSKERGADVS